VISRFPRMLTSLVLTALACAVFALPAFGSAQDVIRDCSEDGVLNHHYSHSELTKALAQLPSDIDEYTDCRAVIRSAQLRSAGGKRGVPAGVDTTTPASANEQKKVDAAHSNGPVQIGGKGVVPGASGAPAKAAGFGTDLPPLVLAVLIALGAAMIGAAVLTLQRHPGFARAGAPLVEPFRKAVTRVRDGISRFRR
jgi:hypothetical protein